MERKIQNSKLMQKEKRRACSVKPTYKTSNGMTDKYDIQQANSVDKKIDVPPSRESRKSKEHQKLTYCSSTLTPRKNMPGTSEDALKAELLRCKKELNNYNDASKVLEQKYMKINVELNDMQQRHEQFLQSRKVQQEPNETECTIKHKYEGTFSRGSGILLLTGQSGEMRILDGIESLTSTTTTRRTIDERQSAGEHFDLRCDREISKASIFDTPEPSSFDRLNSTSNMDKIYEALEENSQNKEKSMIAQPKTALDGIGDGINELRHLQKTVLDLQKEQTHFCNVIQRQRSCLRHYRERLDKMKRTMESQENEIEKLRKSRRDLQARVNDESLDLRHQLDNKRRDVIAINHKLRDVQARYDQAVKENISLHKHVRSLQAQAKEMKAKLEDLNNRKANVLNRLKNAERDLRVLRNYNASLKTDRQKKIEEINKFREQLEEQKTNSKRALTRQRDISDRYCRELQQRITSLEQKLGRNNNSTSGVLQQREKLISELQTQITTLVNNFEISQKHIRLLRRQVSNAAACPANAAVKPIQRKKM